KIAVVADHDAAFPASQGEGHKIGAWAEERRFMSHALSLPPQMRLAVIGHDSFLSDQCCSRIVLSGVALDQAIQDERIRSLQRLLERLGGGSLPFFGQFPDVLHITSHQSLVKQ